MKLARPQPRTLAWAAVAGTVAVALPLVVPVEHHFPWDAVPGFYALFGALGGAAIVVVSKWLGHALLQRPETWYGEADAPERPGPDGPA